MLWASQEGNYSKITFFKNSFRYDHFIDQGRDLFTRWITLTAKITKYDLSKYRITTSYILVQKKEILGSFKPPLSDKLFPVHRVAQKTPTQSVGIYLFFAFLFLIN